MSEKVVVLDSNSLINRAFYALPLLKNSKGIYTNAAYGFMSMMFKMINDIKPDYIAAAFDKKTPTFRHEEYKDYKAGRKKMPDELVPQFDIIKKLLNAMDIRIFEKDGFEADDIIGTFAEKNDEAGLDTIIVTGDRDSLQLISDHTTVYITKKGISETEVFSKEYLNEKLGLKPEQIIDLKGLMGDSSDNIPGVPGVGEKTALKLLAEFGTIENLYENVENVKGKLKDKLIDNKQSAFFSKELATIIRDVPFEFDYSDLKFKNSDMVNLRPLFSELEFNSLAGRIPSDESDKQEGPSIQVKEIDTLDGLKDILDSINKSEYLALNIDDKISIALPDNIEYYIPYKLDLISDSPDLIDILDILKPVFETDSIKKILHDAKTYISKLKKYSINLNGIYFDTMIAAYLLDSSAEKYDMSVLIEKYTGYKKNKTEITAADTLKLYKKFEEELKRTEMLDLFNNIEMPLISVLADMESIGFRVDKGQLEVLGKEFTAKINELTDDIYKTCGEEFNINSPKQLGHILFEVLKLPVIKKTKTGYSTDAEVLEQLASIDPIVKYIIEYRQLMKLNSTYVDGLISVIDKSSGRIHSSFNQTVTATGRISSTEPNLQNIPVRMEIGRNIRKAFVSSGPDYVIVDADYSQIELRVLAHMADDPVLIDAFLKKQDIHRRTASEVFNVPLDDVTSEMRSNAKAVNFGIVYGISDFGLARNLGIGVKQASEYIKMYLEKYKGVKEYMDKAVADAKENGYVITLMNRRRYLPELSSRNYHTRSFGERVAMNAPIQGTAADIIKKAMVDVNDELKRQGLVSKLILQVHDELLIDTYIKELDTVKQIVKQKMENVIKLKVPLIADVKSASNWYDAK